MTARQFIAPTAREALDMVRNALGPDAVILQNRKVPEGVAVTAMRESDLEGLQAASRQAVPQRPAARRPVSDVAPDRAADRASVRPSERVADRISARSAARDSEPGSSSVSDDGRVDPGPAMSTVNFERFANERSTRRQRNGGAHSAIASSAPDDVAPPRHPLIGAKSGERPGAASRDAGQISTDRAPGRVETSRSDVPFDAPIERHADTRRATRSEAGSGARSQARSDANATDTTNATDATDTTPGSGLYRRDRDETAHELMQMAGELRQMRSFISEQFSSLSWVDGVRRTPAQARLLRRMLDAGFSTRLARAMIGHLPAELDPAAADEWLAGRLAANLGVNHWQDGLLDGGGVFALVGPTGVGKTTSVAKIAARFALVHGVETVGLITADAYRVGAQDQLRRFGSMIGITVHAAHDAQGLAGLLKLLSRKRLVLIDTAGLGQRDPRVADLLAAVTRGSVQRLLVLSAAAQVEALQESIAAYHGETCAGVLLTKTDEACRLGGALDALIRDRLMLVAIGNGQRVPEDWLEPDALALVEQALASGADDGPGISDIELTMLMQRAETARPDTTDGSGAH